MSQTTPNSSPNHPKTHTAAVIPGASPRQRLRLHCRAQPQAWPPAEILLPASLVQRGWEVLLGMLRFSPSPSGHTSRGVSGT